MKNADTPRASSGPVFNWQFILWTLVIWLFFSYIFQGIFYPAGTVRPISYTRFKQDVANGSIEEVIFKGNQIKGTYKPGRAVNHQDQGSGTENRTSTSTPSDSLTSPVYFTTIKPDIQDTQLLPMLETHKVTVSAETQKQHWFISLLSYLLPWFLILGLFFYLSKKAQERMMGSGSGGGIFGFSKSKARLLDQQSVTVTYEDVAGLDNAKTELKEIRDFLKDPSRFRELGGELPKGVLLVGPPGVGKTLLAQATAGEAGVSFFSISGSEFIEMFVGIGASRVRDLFKKAKKKAPSIIFVDELDSIGRTRGTGLGGGHDEREQTLNQILTEMDGFAGHESVVVMAATNRPDVLDAALVRPGRFDRRITLDLPLKDARKKILAIHTRGIPMDEGVDLEMIARLTPGFSGADLKNLCNEAAILAAREKKATVDTQDFDQSRDKIMMGLEREEVIRPADREVIACHEAGHTIVSHELPETDPIQKVTIIPRGNALGVTEQVPEEDRYNLKKKYLINRLGVLMGGRAAERIIFNEISNGAADDLKKATDLARQMVCQWGMSEKIGPVTFKLGSNHPFLGQELTEPRDFSEQTAREIDEEVRSMIADMEIKAIQILEKNRDKLTALSDALLENETLDRDAVLNILKNKKQ